MKKKMIAIDLDGTALSNHSTLSQKTIQTLKKVAKNGHKVIIATGRPYRLSIDFYKQLTIETPMINFNGGLITPHNSKEKSICLSKIHRQTIADILTMKADFSTKFVSIEDKENFFVDNFQNCEPTFFGTASFSAKHLFHHSNIPISPISMLMSVDEKMPKEEVANYIRTKFSHYLSVNTWGGENSIIEISKKGTNKASALLQIANDYGISSENIIAFGDEQNDREMLQAAGLGVAMKNARDEIKKLADAVTSLSNDEDGVAKFLEDELGLT